MTTRHYAFTDCPDWKSGDLSTESNESVNCLTCRRLMSGRKADTYLVAGKNEIECRRCGARQAFELPMSVALWVTIVKDFNKVHAKCQPPQTSPTSGA